MPASQVVASKARNLTDIATQIDDAHARVRNAFKSATLAAIEAGQLLIQAKEQVPHGQWETWVSENTAVSPRTASAYLRVARHWTEADDANRQRVADLSLRALLAELAGPSFQLPSHRTQSDNMTSIVKGRAAQLEEEPKTNTVANLGVRAAFAEMANPPAVIVSSHDPHIATDPPGKLRTERCGTLTVVGKPAAAQSAILNANSLSGVWLDQLEPGLRTLRKIAAHTDPSEGSKRLRGGEITAADIEEITAYLASLEID